MANKKYVLRIGNQRVTNPEKLYQILKKKELTYLVFKRRYRLYGNQPHKLFAKYKINNNIFLINGEKVSRKYLEQKYQLSPSTIEIKYYNYGSDMMNVLNGNVIYKYTQRENRQIFRTFDLYMEYHKLTGRNTVLKQEINQNENFVHEHLTDNNFLQYTSVKNKKTLQIINPIQSWQNGEIQHPFTINNHSFNSIEEAIQVFPVSKIKLRKLLFSDKNIYNKLFYINHELYVSLAEYARQNNINYKTAWFQANQNKPYFQGPNTWKEKVRKRVNGFEKYLPKDFSINLKHFNDVNVAAKEFNLSPDTIIDALAIKSGQGKMFYKNGVLYPKKADFKKATRTSTDPTKHRVKGSRIHYDSLKAIEQRINKYQSLNRLFTISEFKNIIGSSSTTIYTILHKNKHFKRDAILNDIYEKHGFIVQNKQFLIKPEFVKYILDSYYKYIQKVDTIIIPFTNSRYSVDINTLIIYDEKFLSLVNYKGQRADKYGKYRIEYENSILPSGVKRHIKISQKEIKSIIKHPEITYKNLCTQEQLKNTYSRVILQNLILANLPEYTRHDEKGNLYKGFSIKDVQRVVNQLKK